jgi:hypothetical protein
MRMQASGIRIALHDLSIFKDTITVQVYIYIHSPRLSLKFIICLVSALIANFKSLQLVNHLSLPCL